ncbi:MAG TPA: DUF4344 domain-containing metallopeptidase [Candidatus Binatia bacterium]|jgi:hypothetical protein
MGKTRMIFLIIALCLMACRKHENRPDTRPPPPESIEPKKSPPFIESKNNLIRVRFMTLAVTEFVLFHELGHMIVEDFNPPVIGQEENGVDRFAALIMTPPLRRADLPPDTFDPAVEPDTPAVMWATWFWHRLFTLQQELGTKPDFADSHGLNVQRSLQIMCLVYGSDPARFERPFAPSCHRNGARSASTNRSRIVRPGKQSWDGV